MLEQALEYFQKEYDRNGGDALILDNYIPADGTYLVVERTGEGFYVHDPITVKLDKNTREIDRMPIDMDFICMADYNSCLVEMNKPMDKTKQIHSNNYLSFFVKKPVLRPENGQPPKLTEGIIKDYFQTMRNPLLKYEGKGNTKKLYLSIEEELGKPDTVRIDEIEQWILSNIFELGEKYTGNDYLKIFFQYGAEEEEWTADYQREGRRYLIPNIFNSNDNNITIDGRIFGMPNNNMGLNSKKPYLETKSRKTPAPYLVDTEQVLLQKHFFDYLMNLAAGGKVNVYLTDEKVYALKYNETLNPDEEEFTGLYLRLKKGKEVEIHDVDIISDYHFNLPKEMELKNCFSIDVDHLKLPYTTVRTLSDMQTLVDQLFFGKQLIPNYFTEAKDISTRDTAMARSILACRSALFHWFFKGDSQNVWPVLKRIGLPMIKDSINNGYRIRAINQFNLYMALEEYFEGGSFMGDQIIARRARLKEKIESDIAYEIEDDQEYFYAAGQVAGYLISKSKAGKVTLSLANPIINAKQDIVVKSKLQILYKRYNHDLVTPAEVRFKNLYAMVLRYEPEGAVNEMMLTAGFLDLNLLYEKTKKNLEKSNKSAAVEEAQKEEK